MNGGHQIFTMPDVELAYNGSYIIDGSLEINLYDSKTDLIIKKEEFNVALQSNHFYKVVFDADAIIGLSITTGDVWPTDPTVLTVLSIDG